MIKITNRTINGNIAEITSNDGRFVWSFASPDYVKDTVADKAIYQMRYMRKAAFGSDPLPDDLVDAVLMFHDRVNAALSAEKAEIQAAADADSMKIIDEERRNVNPAKAQAYDNLHNEGGEGYNPYR